MDQPRLVQSRKSSEKRLDHAKQLIRRDAASALLGKLGKSRPLDVLHHDVYRVVRLEEVADADDDLLLVHAGHGARFT